jgi:hypothetical protein
MIKVKPIKAWAVVSVLDNKLDASNVYRTKNGANMTTVIHNNTNLEYKYKVIRVLITPVEGK